MCGMAPGSDSSSSRSLYLNRHRCRAVGVALAATCCFLWLIAGTVVVGETLSEPRKMLSFRGQPAPLANSSTLPPDHYSGEGNIVLVAGNQGLQCSLVVEPGSTIEDLKLVVRSGGDVKITGSLLRRCHIAVEPKAKVSIEGSGLDYCELSGFGGYSQGFPSIKLVNTVIADTVCLKAVNVMGLKLIDCLVLSQKMAMTGFRVEEGAGDTFATLANTPAIQETTFKNSRLHPDLLMTAANCTFIGCALENYKPADNPSDPGNDPALFIKWLDGVPADVASPHVGVRVETSYGQMPEGCTVEHQWDGRALTLAAVAPHTAGVPVALRTSLPLEAPVAVSMPSNTVATGLETTADAPARAKLKLQQTFVNGLLVMPLPSGKEAGVVTKMNLSVLPDSVGLTFAQPVASDMEMALREVEKLMRLRHHELPQDQRMEIAFEEKYSGKGGPSAAVACALLIESAWTGIKWDPAFAVTGDLNADGSIQPIGGVAAKIRGATNGSCKIVGIPSKNEISISDILVRDGPGPLANITVFALKTIEEAVALAAAERSGQLREALAEMEVITSVLRRDPRAMTTVLRTPHAVARLQSVLAKAPNCISAKYLLLYAMGRSPTKLSLAGSIEAADNDGQALVAAVNRDFNGATTSLQLDELGGSLNKLRNLRPILDLRVWPYVDSLVDFGSILREVILNPLKSNARAVDFERRGKQAASNVGAAKDKLISDAAVREELGL